MNETVSVSQTITDSTSYQLLLNSQINKLTIKHILVTLQTLNNILFPKEFDNLTGKNQNSIKNVS